MIADIIIIAILVVACFFIIRGMVKNIKAGKSACGCGGDCSKCKNCH